MFRTGPLLLSLFGFIITPWQHKMGLFFLAKTQFMGKNQNSVAFSGKPNKQREECFPLQREKKYFYIRAVFQMIHIVGYFNRKVTKQFGIQKQYQLENI